MDIPRKLSSLPQLALFAFLLAPTATYAQHEPHGPYDKEPHIQAPPAAAPAPPPQDDPAEAARQAELAEDKRIVEAGGIVKVVRSPEYWSGEGKDFSRWYTLASGSIPVGYVLVSDVFHLVGDRACNAWSECRKVASFPNGVIWKFRMQGHDENQRLTLTDLSVPGENNSLISLKFRSEGRKATSVGILKTRYLPARP